MAAGVVKWFNSEKGLGVITEEDSSTNLFAYRADISRPAVSAGVEQPTLVEGQKVMFDVIQGQRGPEAKNIVVVG